MTFTSHGHHIPGTLDLRPYGGPVARCGGPGLCPVCSQEAGALASGKATPFMGFAMMKSTDEQKIMQEQISTMVKQLREEEEKAFLKWLHVDTVEKAAAVIKALEDGGFKVSVEHEPFAFATDEISADNFVYRAESVITFKLVPPGAKKEEN